MKAFLIIISLVLGSHLAIKAILYAGMKKTTGRIVDFDQYVYGRARLGSGKNVVKVPLAEFRDIDNQEIASEVTLGEVLKLVNWDSINKYNAERIILEKQKELIHHKKIREGIYITIKPDGGYYFDVYKLGDTVPVIYDSGEPQKAFVPSFFSYWLTIQALCWLPLITIFIFGLHKFALYASQDVLKQEGY